MVGAVTVSPLTQFRLTVKGYNLLFAATPPYVTRYPAKRALTILAVGVIEATVSLSARVAAEFVVDAVPVVVGAE
jgi:hypothetical protein